MALLILPLIAVFIYLPSMHGGFLFDDIPNIVDNKPIHLDKFSFESVVGSLAGANAGPLGRPVSVLSLALTHLFFGMDSYAFKLINLLIHLINGLLVALLTFLLAKNRPFAALSTSVRQWLVVWVSGAWLLHPIQFVAINMAVQRMTLLATFFTLLSLIFCLKAYSPQFGVRAKFMLMAAAWLVCWPLACLSKETGLLFPAFVMIITIFLLATADSVRVKAVAIFGGVGLSASAFLYWYIGISWLDVGYVVRNFTLEERLLTEARVMWFYFFQIVFPSYEQYAVYLDWIPLSRSIDDPITTLFSLLAWFLVFVGLVKFWRSHPVVVFGITWFLFGHGLESTFVPLEIAHEHRNYLPSYGLLLMIGFIGARFFELLSARGMRVISIVAPISALVVFAVFTGLRSVQMSNPLVGSQIEAIRHAMSARANYVAASNLFKSGFGDANDPIGGKSIKFYLEQAERSDSMFKFGYLGLVIWACASDREIESEWVGGLLAKLETTPFGYAHLTFPNHLLRPLITMPKCLSRSDAIGLFEAGSRNPMVKAALQAQFLEAAGDYEIVVHRDPVSASRYYLAAVERDPTNIGLRNKTQGLTSD